MTHTVVKLLMVECRNHDSAAQLAAQRVRAFPIVPSTASCTLCGGTHGTVLAGFAYARGCGLRRGLAAKRSR